MIPFPLSSRIIKSPGINYNGAYFRKGKSWDSLTSPREGYQMHFLVLTILIWIWFVVWNYEQFLTVTSKFNMCVSKLRIES